MGIPVYLRCNGFSRTTYGVSKYWNHQAGNHSGIYLQRSRKSYFPETSLVAQMVKNLLANSGDLG